MKKFIITINGITLEAAVQPNGFIFFEFTQKIKEYFGLQERYYNKKIIYLEPTGLLYDLRSITPQEWEEYIEDLEHGMIQV